MMRSGCLLDFSFIKEEEMKKKGEQK